MNKLQEQVTEFHRAFGHPVRFAPAELKGHDKNRRIAWMLEEIAELQSATNIVEQADAVCDLVYFAIGFLVEAGVDVDLVFSAIHKANMRKLHDGKVIRGTDGKVIKPEGWIGPESEILLGLTSGAMQNALSNVLILGDKK